MDYNQKVKLKPYNCLFEKQQIFIQTHIATRDFSHMLEQVLTVDSCDDMTFTARGFRHGYVLSSIVDSNLIVKQDEVPTERIRSPLDDVISDYTPRRHFNQSLVTNYDGVTINTNNIGISNAPIMNVSRVNIEESRRYFYEALRETQSH